jgi:ABC-type uncharacterized transport system substrate-binding protein
MGSDSGSSDDSSPKQLLTTIVPNVSRIGRNPDTETYSSVLNNAQDAARKVGLSLVPIEARNSREIEDAFPRARILCSGRRGHRRAFDRDQRTSPAAE